MLSVRTPFPPSAFALLAELESNHWWFLARNRVLLWTMATKIRPFLSFMEVGCGTGYVLEGVRKAYPAAALFGAEYFEEGLAFARQRVPTASLRQLDVSAMDETNCYDVIGAFDVIEHVEQDEAALSNLARAIKPGGSLVITVPQHRWLWSRVDEDACHRRRYSRVELIEKINRAGLKVDYATSFVSLLLPLMWLSRLRSRKKDCAPISEFRIPRWLNKILGAVMNIEFMLLKIGLRLPVGGSLLVVAKKGP